MKLTTFLTTSIIILVIVLIILTVEFRSIPDETYPDYMEKSSLNIPEIDDPGFDKTNISADPEIMGSRLGKGRHIYTGGNSLREFSSSGSYGDTGVTISKDLYIFTVHENPNGIPDDGVEYFRDKKNITSPDDYYTEDGPKLYNPSDIYPLTVPDHEPLV
jgi:hypothetical protein